MPPKKRPSHAPNAATHPVAHTLHRSRHDHVAAHFKRGLRMPARPTNPPSPNSDQTGGA